MSKMHFKRKCKFAEKCIIILVFFLFFVQLQLIVFTNPESGIPRKFVDDREFLARLRGPLSAVSLSALKILMQKYLHSPSKKSYNLMANVSSKEASSYNTYRAHFEGYIRCKDILQRFFSNSSPGFFIESGAMDGEFLSNTLYLEQTLGWTGLLIEPDARSYKNLLKKNRKSWSSNTCISNRNYPKKESFLTYSNEKSSIINEMLTRSTSNVDGVLPPAAGLMGKKQQPTIVQCFPLYSYMLALNKTDVDYISLDVEGAEAEILITFPWTKVNVMVWSIEHRLLSNHFQDYMRRKRAMLTLSDDTSTIFENYFDTKNNDHDGTDNTSYTIESNDTVEVVIKHVRKVVYSHERSPAEGQDDHFVDFMVEKGYRLVDYWDGDYTFVKKDSYAWKKLANYGILGVHYD